MREAVTDEFGASYVGWMGQHGKYPVYGTKLMDVIFSNKLIVHICVCFTNIIRYDLASVDRSPLLPSATKKQVDGATMNYIHGSNVSIELRLQLLTTKMEKTVFVRINF
jgi:hypothetical protein